MKASIGLSKPSKSAPYSSVVRELGINDMLAVIQRNWAHLSAQKGYLGIQDAIGLYARYGAIDICEEYKKALEHEKDIKNRFIAWQNKRWNKMVKMLNVINKDYDKL